MNETSTKKRPGILVIAAVLAVPAFAGGVLVGKSSPNATAKEVPSARDELAEPTLGNAVSRELAACQRKLARRKKVPAASSVTGEHPAETEREAATEERLAAPSWAIFTALRALGDGAILAQTWHVACEKNDPPVP